MNALTYPLRPINGGPLPKSAPKTGDWTYEAKVNGWRALVHCESGRMFNRKGEPLSIAGQFDGVLNALEGACNDPALEWLDCEAFERRHALGKGSLVVPGQTLGIVECAPAAYIAVAANEAEKAADINILEVRAFGSFGRVYIGGEEKDVEAARPAAVQALAALTGREHAT